MFLTFQEYCKSTKVFKKLNKKFKSKKKQILFLNKMELYMIVLQYNLVSDRVSLIQKIHKI